MTASLVRSPDHLSDGATGNDVISPSKKIPDKKYQFWRNYKHKNSHSVVRKNSVIWKKLKKKKTKKKKKISTLDHIFWLIGWVKKHTRSLSSLGICRANARERDPPNTIKSKHLRKHSRTVFTCRPGKTNTTVSKSFIAGHLAWTLDDSISALRAGKKFATTHSNLTEEQFHFFVFRSIKK